MLDKTLYLIQSNYATTDNILDQLLKLISTDDQVVLMGDAVLFHQDSRLENNQNLFILENDGEILVESLPSNIHLISYAQFANLALDFKRCVSLK